MNIGIGACAVLAFLGLTFQAHAPGQPATAKRVGTVEGRVVNSKGLPVEGATVYAAPTEESELIQNGLMAAATSDDQGRFVLRNVVVGTNMILGSKEEEAYCSTLYAPFVQNFAELPRVVVQEEVVSRGVVVTLPSCATLHGVITDRTTGSPIPEAQIHLIRQDNPNLDLITSPDIDGKFRFVLPKLPYTIEVYISGYKTWKRADIKMDPGTAANISIQLEKIP